MARRLAPAGRSAPAPYTGAARHGRDQARTRHSLTTAAS